MKNRKSAAWFFTTAFCFFLTATAAIGLVPEEARAFSVTLGWDPNTESNLAGYKIYYDTDSGVPYRYVITVPLSSPGFDRNSPEYTVNGLTDGTVYFFALTAYNNVGLESGYSNEVSTGRPNSAPVLSSLEVNGAGRNTTIYTNAQDRKVSVRIVAADDRLVQQYLILDGSSNPEGRTFLTIPDGPSQNPIFTISDFVLNNMDGNHTIHAWVKDDQGALSSSASKTNVVLDRVPPNVSLTYSSPGPYNAGQTVTVTARLTDSSPILGTPKISIQYAGTGGAVSGVDMAPLGSQTWTYRMVIPTGSEGTGIIRVTAFDAAGNSTEGHTGAPFVVGSPSPGVVGFPVLNHTGGSITVTYSESNMRNAGSAKNYSFDNGLLLSGDGADVGGMRKVFKLPLNTGTLQPYTIYTLHISADITNSAGRKVVPNSIRVNDDDNDGMADDWEKRWFGSIPAKNGAGDSDGDGLTDRQEYEYARSNPGSGPGRWDLSPLNPDSDGDGIPDPYEILHGLNPVDPSDRDLDPDQDGWSNYEEFLHGTAANDPSSFPRPRDAIEVVAVIPPDNTGAAPDRIRVPNNTAFAVRIESLNGVDLTDPEGVVFNISDGRSTYPRMMNVPNSRGAKILQAVPLESDGNTAYSFWAVYYRSNETTISSSFPHDATVQVTVSVKDRTNQAMKPLAFRFRVQSQEEDGAAKMERPATSTKVDALSGLKTILIEDGLSQGASITYESTLAEDIGLEPYFGAFEDIPVLTAAEPVGAPLNLLPPAVFPRGVVITIPCPGFSDVGDLSIYSFDGEQWVAACDPAGRVLPGGDGWMVPGSRVNHHGDPSTIEIEVYHFSAVAAGGSPAAGENPAPGFTTVPEDPPGLASGTGGGACFISAAWGKID